MKDYILYRNDSSYGVKKRLVSKETLKNSSGIRIIIFDGYELLIFHKMDEKLVQWIHDFHALK